MRMLTNWIKYYWNMFMDALLILRQQWSGLCRVSDKSLSKPMITWFNDAYKRHSASMIWIKMNQLRTVYQIPLWSSVKKQKTWHSGRHFMIVRVLYKFGCGFVRTSGFIYGKMIWCWGHAQGNATRQKTTFCTYYRRPIPNHILIMSFSDLFRTGKQ